MYTGIVHGAYPIKALAELPGLRRFVIELNRELVDGLTIGASVGADGVCLTVTAMDGCDVSFDVMQETLSLTTLGQVEQGGRVNIERSAKYGDEIGGHGVSGHVDSTAELVAIDESDNNREISYRVPAALLDYIFHKGFIAINGCSLTVAAVDREAATFKVCLIPETLRVTTHGDKKIGDRVNIEVDRQTQAIVDTVKAYLGDNPELLRSIIG